MVLQTVTGYSMIIIDKILACEIVKNRLRKEREEVFKDLDVEFMRLLEKGSSVVSVTEYKNALRDVTEKDFQQLSIEDLARLSLKDALTLP